MPSPDTTTRAFALGAVSGLRTFGALGPLGARGRLGGRAGRVAFPILLAGELAGDKHPSIPPRSDPPALAGRLAAGATAGLTVAGAPGVGLGVAGAAATTFLSQQLRATLAERMPLPDPVLGGVEDAVVITIAALASSDEQPDETADEPGSPSQFAGPDSEPEKSTPPSPVAAAARGLLACAVATAAMTTVQNAYQTATGADSSDAPAQVGRRIIGGAFGRRVPRRHRDALNQGMHFLYGTSWGLPFGLLAARGRDVGSPAAGLGLGLAVWAVGLAELPALKLAPPPWRQSPVSLATDLVFHLVYGGTAGAAYAALDTSSS